MLLLLSETGYGSELFTGFKHAWRTQSVASEACNLHSSFKMLVLLAVLTGWRGGKGAGGLFLKFEKLFSIFFFCF